MLPRRETHSGAGMAIEDHNVGVGLVRKDGLPPPPPIHLLVEVAIARANTQAPAPVVAANPVLPLENLHSLGGVEFRGLEPREAEEWLASTEHILDQIECTDTRKLGVTSPSMVTCPSAIPTTFLICLCRHRVESRYQ
ncbi:hypothetical protein V6N13_142068 [Hibiscus sabdariffa]